MSMTVEQLEAQLAAIMAALDKLRKEEADTGGVDVIPDVIPEGPLKFGDPDNLWRRYYDLEEQKIRPVVPNLEIPEGAEQYGNWFWDGEGFIFAPLLALRDKYLAGKGISYGRIRGEAGKRIRRYAGKHFLPAAIRYATLPAGFSPDPDYLNWLRFNRNEGQRKRVHAGWGAKFKSIPVYQDFSTSDEASNAWDSNIPVPESKVYGMAYLFGGNLLDGEDMIDAHKRACRAFETYWLDGFDGQRSVLDSAKSSLRELDTAYRYMNDAAKAEFLIKNPGYEPVE
jgi:hypothetical protein